MSSLEPGKPQAVYRVECEGTAKAEQKANALIAPPQEDPQGISSHAAIQATTGSWSGTASPGVPSTAGSYRIIIVAPVTRKLRLGSSQLLVQGKLGRSPHVGEVSPAGRRDHRIPP